MKHINETDFFKPAVLGLLLASIALPSCAQKVVGENIALHCPATFSVPPNYGLTRDEEDAKQITDGVYTKGKFWTGKTSVGWEERTPVVITIDLGKVQPISGVSYNTAAGDAGVTWPPSILIATSDDAKTWHYAGDLVMLDENGEPPSGYGLHRYTTHQLKTKGRYLALGVVDKPYLFTDEVEVYRGPETLLARERVGAKSDDIKSLLLYNAVQGRLQRDAKAVEDAVAASALPAPQKAALQARLDGLRDEMQQLPLPDPETLRAVLPLNDLHARILAIHAVVLHARQLPPIVAWKKHRYDVLSPVDAPTSAPSTPTPISIEMMQSEQRADAFLLTNTTEEPITADVRLEGLPGAPHPSWFSVSSVPWTDTFYYQWVASALPDAEYSRGAYRVTIPAGVTRKVWLGADSSQLAPGEHRGTLRIEGAGREVRLPFKVRVSTLAMKRPRFSLSVWDYTSGDGARSITTGYKTLQPALALMQSHGVDTTWSERRVLPWPGEKDFDADGKLNVPLDFNEFDEWVKRWPNARHYLVFLNVENQSDFAGAKMGTAQFNARVGSWAKAITEHLRAIKVKPEQLGLLLVDEPRRDTQDEITVAWMRALKSAAPDLVIFTDPIWKNPQQAKHQEAITQADIISPELSFFCAADDSTREYYAARRANGQTLWFYQVGGLVPAHIRDPSQFYRGQAWRAFRYGATGEGFWAFGDTAGARSSWLPYLISGIAYAPVFFDINKAQPDASRVTNSLHWEATREGVEDYEYLAMLRDAAQHATPALKARAEKLLAELPALLGKYPSDIRWQPSELPAALDDYRLRVLALLEQMEEAR